MDSHINALTKRRRNEQKIISEKAVLNFLENSEESVSAMEIAMEIEVSTYLVRHELSRLKRLNLVFQDYHGNWDIKF